MVGLGKELVAGPPTRPYRSPQRQQQALRTRRRILAAAHEEFLASGYARTTMATVAARAAVSSATVEKAFGTKAALLKTVVDVAIVGDDQPVPVLGRASAARVDAAASVSEFLARVADLLGDGQQRSARLVCVLFEAASTDGALQPLVRQRLDERRVIAEWIVDGFAGYIPLRTDLDDVDAIDIVWSLMEPILYCRLTGERQWSLARYKDWFADSVARLLGSATREAP